MRSVSGPVLGLVKTRLDALASVGLAVIVLVRCFSGMRAAGEEFQPRNYLKLAMA